MSEIMRYESAVRTIKSAILEGQFEAAKSVNEKQLFLYFAIGKYVSENTRSGKWGQNAVSIISEQLQSELPGLRGFSARNIRSMRNFYEKWAGIESGSPESVSIFAAAAAKSQEAGLSLILQPRLQNLENIDRTEFFGISFTHHTMIIDAVKDVEERLFYIHLAYSNKLSKRELRLALNNDEYHHSGTLPNNFEKTLSPVADSLKAISMFKDEYLLDFINVEEIDARKASDVNSRLVQKEIIDNIKNFILTFGKSFAFVASEYHLQAFGEDEYIDLLFFNRELNCLVAVELKKGKFKPSYLGQLSGYLSILDQYEKKDHENPAVGIILCSDVNKPFVDFLINDYSKPMGVARYKTANEMGESLKDKLPDIDDLRVVITNKGEE